MWAVSENSNRSLKWLFVGKTTHHVGKAYARLKKQKFLALMTSRV